VGAAEVETVSGRIGFLFPGQGGYIPGALAQVTDGGRQVAAVLDAVEAVAGEYGQLPVAPLVLDRSSPSLEELAVADPDRIQLAVFACSVAGAALLGDYGLVPDVVFGHSFGEISALTVAGALSVAEGTRVVCERIAAVRRAAPQPGGLLVVQAGAARTEHLLGAVDDWRLALAAENTPTQTVVSGPDQALARLAGAAQALGLRTFRLPVPGQFHNPALAAAADDFAARLRRVPFAEPRIRVYCDLTGNYLNGDDDMRRLLCAHMVRPVRFLSAVRALHADGVTTFVECGARDVLTRLVTDCLPQPVLALAPLRPHLNRAALDDLLRPLSVPWQPTGPAGNLRPTGGTPPEPATPSRDWAADGTADGWVDVEAADMPAGAVATAGGVTESARSDLPADAVVLDELRRLYAEALEYPPEVFADHADLEGDLGIDSLKQTELLGRVLDRYGVTAGAGQIRTTEYPTLAAVATLLRRLTPA
jgi:acyl transferase domain-containing protein/acyl carrier protein